MHKEASNAAHESSIVQSGQSQSAHTVSANKPSTFHFGRKGPESISRSEAGVSADLSAASNMAAQGEEPMDLMQHSGGNLMARLGSRQSGDAEKWFQDSNKNASTRGNVSFTDDDPPFHLPHRPTEPTGRHLPVRAAENTSTFQPPSLQHYPSIQSSSSGEFRAVIDDLTVENQKLKKKLKRYELSNVKHLHPDRMFEVRMPGLVGKDKQRLERLLQDFAASISGSDTRGQYAEFAKKRSKKGDSSKKPSSSSTLHSNPVDSAYASGSGSAGHASGSQHDSRTLVSDSASRNKSRGGSGSKDYKVRSYLQNISQGLLPQRPTAMTENARKKEVVKRLEQLFTGRASTNEKNSQSAQQQEVSTAAANADNRASEARGRPIQAEGNREANILPAEAEAAMLRNDASNDKSKSKSSPAEATHQAPTDQRPTRPLDLDLNRAQNAADNIAYIQHLGFAPRTVINEDQGDDGWMYLNLIMGLAQLHTANVTPDFVRQAVKDVSDKFELSSDGSKIRWRGGTEGTRMSGDSGSSAGSKNCTPSDTDVALKLHSPRSSKPSTEQTPAAVRSSAVDNSSRTKLSSRDLSISTDATPSGSRPPRKRPIFLGHVGREDSFQYEPMFLHGAGSDDEGDYFLNEDSSLMSSGLREDATGSGRSSSRTKRTQPTTVGGADGPMIFYRRARFVTDLSGDHGITPVNHTAYDLATQHALGAKIVTDKLMYAESKDLISKTEPHVLSAALQSPTEECQLPRFDEGVTSTADQKPDNHPQPLVVSGIGGVTPAENLVFYTKHLLRSRKRKAPVSTDSSRYRKCAPHILSKLLDGERALLERITAQDRLDVRLEGVGPVKHLDLSPSELPPPSYAYMPFSSSNEDEDERSTLEDDFVEDDEFSGENSGGDLMPDFAPPALMLTHDETNSLSGSEESDVDEDMDDGDSDDEEVDFLAHERALNAEEVAEREREWENGLKDPSPDAASSQATVGDRSFLSDEEDGNESSHRSDKRRSTHAGSKRGREEVEGEAAVPASPAKRVETLKTKSGKK